MRRVQYVLLMALGLGLMTLFQNCGDGKMTVTRSVSASSSSETLPLQTSQITQVNSTTISKTMPISDHRAHLDLSDLASPVSALEFEVDLNGVNFRDAVMTLKSDDLPRGTEVLQPDLLCNPTTAGSGLQTNLIHGFFVRSKTREIYVNIKGATGIADSTSGWFTPTQILADIYIRPAGTTSLNFEKIFCSMYQ